MDRLRGRGRLLNDAADPADLVPARPHPRRHRTRPFPAALSIAALTCYRPGHRSRLIYRPKRHPDHRSGQRRSFAWTDYRDLLIAAHHQLGGPLVLIWGNLNVHRDARLRAFIDAQDGLRVYYLPPYAPDLNPVESIWSLLRRSSQANRAFTDPEHLLGTLRRGLRRLQYRREVIDGCLAATGLNLTTSRLQAR